MRLEICAAVLAWSVCVGCATVGGSRVKPDDYTTDGVRYWLAAPYLLVRTPVEVARTDAIFQLNAGSASLAPLSTGTAPSSPTGPNLDIPPPPLPAPIPKAPKGAPGPFAGEPPAGGAGLGQAKAPTTPVTSAQTESADAPFSKPEAPAERAAPASWADAVSIVWLPDYCEQYALRQRSVLAGLKVKIALGDGWKLTSLDSEADSTQVMDKVLGLLGTVVTAKKDVAVERIKAEAAAKAPGEEAAAAKYLRRTKVTYLKPGLYSLLTRKTCTERAEVGLQSLAYETGEFWTELALTP